MPALLVKSRVLSLRTGLLACAGLALALPGAQAAAQAVVATGVGTPFELAFWQSIDSSNDASLYEAYLTRFPNGTFSEIARAKITVLHGRMTATSPAPSVSPALTVPVATTAPVAATLPPPPPAPPPPSAAPVAAYAPIAQPAVPAPAVTQPAVAAGPSAGTMSQLLAALASSQTTGGQPIAPPAPAQTAVAYAPVTARQSPGFLLPAQPALSPVPMVNLPASFCSAEARNAFHAGVYAPSVTVAKANNDAAAAYMRQLQSLYDQYQLSHDPDTMNSIVTAARTYQQVAQTTFSMEAGLVRQFTALMAVPVVPCSQPTQPPAQTLVK